VPTLSFVSIPAQMYGNAPFAVSATSASSGAVIYAVVSGPAIISGSTVTLTGAQPRPSPETIPAGSAVTPVTLTMQTSSQIARNEKPSSGEPFAPVALGFLLLPLAGMKVGAQTAATDAAPDRSAGHSGSIPGRSTGIERLRRKQCCQPDRKKLHRGGDRYRCNHRRT
jgi:hypothetical protein